MRTSTLACAITAAILSPILVAAAPYPTPGRFNSQVLAVSKPSQPSGAALVRRAFDRPSLQMAVKKIGPRAFDEFTAGGNAHSGPSGDVSGGGVGTPPRRLKKVKRTTDDGSLGGNAHTGNSGDASGGSVVNQGDNYGMPTLMNVNSNNAGMGGDSISGCANGGHGNTRGAGGNAYAGDAGDAQGGSVSNSGGVMNFDSNNAGAAGLSQTGCATGGDVSDGNPLNE